MKNTHLVGSEILLLVNLAPEDARIVRSLVDDSDADIDTLEATRLEEVESLADLDHCALTIYRAHAGRRRVDQEIRRIKRLLPQSTPMLLLIPPELSSKLRTYLRAGADDYWVLPLDTTAFPSRFRVLLEWGESMLGGDFVAPDDIRQTGAISFWDRLRRGWARLRSAFDPTWDPTAVPGSTIGGKWQRVRRLGFGSFGEVWLVSGREAGETAVIKIPHSTKMNRKFLREASILNRLRDHPNAVSLVEVLKAGGKVILIEEYVEGMTLQQGFDEGMDAAFRETAFLQLVDVVAYAHDQKIMHRDIKPENIIVTPARTVKLLDFGTAKDLSRRSISSTVIGSRPYMAPEQIMGKSRLASDVWALGVVLYALATESLPFYDENEKALMDLILETEPEPPSNLEPDLPEELEAIILMCLQKDPAQRYSDARQLKEALLAAFPRFGSGEVLRGE